MASLTVNLSSELSRRLEALAKESGQPVEVIADKAIDEFVAREVEAIADIRAGLSEAEAGDFATDREVAATFQHLGIGQTRN